MLGVILFVSARYLVFVSLIKLQKSEFRKTILAQENKNIQQLKISAGDLYKDRNGIEWKEHNKEVVINAKFYEVISVLRNGDFCLVSIIEDEMENSLFMQFFATNDSTDDLNDCLGLLFELNFDIPFSGAFKQPEERPVKYRLACNSDYCSGFFFRNIKPPTAL